MIKSISFIVLTHFFQFNQLKIKATRLLIFFKVKPTIFFYSVMGHVVNLFFKDKASFFR